MTDANKLYELLRKAKKLAVAYRSMTGKPLGITGEVAEYEAAKILNLKLTPARQAGYDAQNAARRKFQIKGRCVLPGSKSGQRIGAIDISKKFDSVLLVLLDENLDAFEIHEASRAKVVRTLKEPGSKARNERGQLGIAKFKQVGRCIWHRK